MSNNLIRDALVVSACAAALAYFLTHRQQVYALVGLDIPAQQEEVAAPPPVAKTKVVSGSVVSIPKSKRDGQFWTDARVNSGHVKFLVDTGASSVALTLDDAKKAGIREHELDFNIIIHTAGGENKAARVTLKSISVGPITLRDVDALVVKDGLHVSLLGMTYLGDLQKVEATRDSLILRL